MIDAAQRLRILGVTEDIDALLADADKVSIAKLADEDVVAYAIAAPFNATVTARSAVPSQKAKMSDVLFTLTDVSTVWVSHDVPESNFGLIPRLQTGTIRMTTAAYAPVPTSPNSSPWVRRWTPQRVPFRSSP